jgi:hypothetical protein
MKLPMRPAPRPGGTHGAMKSISLPERLAARAREPDLRQDHADQAAVEAHAALPHVQDLQRVLQVVHRLVEQAVAEPAAHHDAQHAHEQHVLDVAAAPGAGPGHRAERLVLQAQVGQQHEQGEGHQVGDAVPVNGYGAELQRDRIDLGMDQHGRLLWRSISPAGARP